MDIKINITKYLDFLQLRFKDEKTKRGTVNQVNY